MVCFDAKFNFDDSAKFRQKEVFAMEDHSESDPREVEAGKYDLNYIGLDGNIACLGKNKLSVTGRNAQWCIIGGQCFTLFALIYLGMWVRVRVSNKGVAIAKY